MQRLRTARNGVKSAPSMPRYPGIVSTIDGARAVVWVEAHIAQAAFVFPIAPSAAMADAFALEFQKAGKNLWGDEMELTESEHSAASACERPSGCCLPVF